MSTMADLTFTFRNAGPSGHGTGRVRYYVDLRDRCIGSVEGKTGDFRLDADYVSDGSVTAGARSFHTRVQAAQALANLSVNAQQPPISAGEYRLLQRCKRGETFEMPLLGIARILASRGLLTQKRGTNEFRSTAKGTAMIQNYEGWVSQRSTEQQGGRR